MIQILEGERSLEVHVVDPTTKQETREFPQRP